MGSINQLLLEERVRTGKTWHDIVGKRVRTGKTWQNIVGGTGWGREIWQSILDPTVLCGIMGLLAAFFVQGAFVQIRWGVVAAGIVAGSGTRVQGCSLVVYASSRCVAGRLALGLGRRGDRGLLAGVVFCTCTSKSPILRNVHCRSHGRGLVPARVRACLSAGWRVRSRGVRAGWSCARAGG